MFSSVYFYYILTVVPRKKIDDSKKYKRAANGYIDPNYVTSAVLSLLICAGIVLFIAFMFFLYTNCYNVYKFAKKKEIQDTHTTCV